MEPERRFPLLGQRTPGLPRVPVKLGGPFGGFGERGDAASARVTAVAYRPAVVQCFPARLGKRDLGIGSEPDRGEPPLDTDALPPCLRDPSRRRPVDPEMSAPAGTKQREIGIDW